MTLTVICLSSFKVSTSITWFSFLIASHLPPFLHIPISLLYVGWIYSLSFFFFLLLTGFVLLLLCDYQASQTGLKYEWKWLNKDFLFRKKLSSVVFDDFSREKGIRSLTLVISEQNISNWPSSFINEN